MNHSAASILDELLTGNRRFREGKGTHRTYSIEDFERIDKEQTPKAAVIACADSRVVPTLLFDQGIGDLFSARVPGNVASETSQWVVELAIREFHVPLVVVLGHTNCLAVRSVLQGDVGSTGGMLRSLIQPAVTQARHTRNEDQVRLCIELNAKNTITNLHRDSAIARRAHESGDVAFVAMLYVMHTGTVELIDR